MRKKIGQIGFFKACDAYRTHYEVIGKQCKSMADLQAFLADKIQFHVPRSTIGEIIDATGLAFTPAPAAGKAAGSANRLAVINAITRLYEEFGIMPEAEFLAYYERSFGRSYKRPVPVASIPKPRDLNIVAG